MNARYFFILLLMSVFAASCSNDLELSDQEGYVRLELNMLTSTNTRAVNNPSDYNPKKLKVQILDSNNTVVMQTEDVDNDAAFKGNIALMAGQYTIKASSAGWDGSGSGMDTPYYVGSTVVNVSPRTLVKANVTLTQANVKVTVTFDARLGEYFSEMDCYVSSKLDAVATQSFSMGREQGAAYFPVGDLSVQLIATNKSGNSNVMKRDITDVKARDHFIINYKLAETGSMGGVNVSVDDATQSYTFDIEVPRKSSIALQAMSADAWATFANLTGVVTAKTSAFDPQYLTLMYKQADAAEWNEVTISQLTDAGNDTYKYCLKGLSASTTYVYRMAYDDGQTSVNSNEMTFTTEETTQIENSSFENWYKDGKSWMPNAQNSTYWSTSNPGSTSMGEQYNVTTQSTDFYHSGASSAKLGTKYVVIKLAAASLFTGEFHGLIGTSGAKLKWGVPFTSRPSSLKGFLSYTGGNVNRTGKDLPSTAPASGSPDACQLFCALLTEPLYVGGNATASANGINYEKSTIIDWQNDPRIIAYGEIIRSENTPSGTWENFEVPLVYNNATKKPTHMVIVIAANKWGDYFHGYDGSVLYIDDLSFEYGQPIFR